MSNLTKRDQAVDNLLGSDSFACITVRRHSEGTVEAVTIYQGDERELQAVASEMLYWARRIIFGEDGGEASDRTWEDDE